MLLLFPEQSLAVSRVTLGAQVLPFLFFGVVPNRTGRLRIAAGALLPTQRDQFFVVTIHAQISAVHGLALQPTPARFIAPARDATLRRNRRSLAIITSMAQTHPDFHVRIVPTRGRLRRPARPARLILKLRQLFIVALPAQTPSLNHFRPVPAPVRFPAFALRALLIRQRQRLHAITRLAYVRSWYHCVCVTKKKQTKSMCLRVRACDCGQYVYKTLSHSLSFQSAKARTRTYARIQNRERAYTLFFKLKRAIQILLAKKEKLVFSRNEFSTFTGEKNSPFDFLHRPPPALSASNVRLQFSFMHVLFASPVVVGWFVIFLSSVSS